MVRLTAQQRAELVQLHLQGESIDAIVQQTGHAPHDRAAMGAPLRC